MITFYKIIAFIVLLNFTTLNAQNIHEGEFEKGEGYVLEFTTYSKTEKNKYKQTLKTFSRYVSLDSINNRGDSKFEFLHENLTSLGVYGFDFGGGLEYLGCCEHGNPYEGNRLYIRNDLDSNLLFKYSELEKDINRKKKFVKKKKIRLRDKESIYLIKIYKVSSSYCLCNYSEKSIQSMFISNLENIDKISCREKRRLRNKLKVR